MDKAINEKSFPNSAFGIKFVSMKDGEEIKYYDYDSFINHLALININAIDEIIVKPLGNNIESILCGIAPIWKKHENKELFERYYTMSETMRTLYNNERESDGSLVPIYIELDNGKFIAAWETTENVEVFYYREPTFEERGLLDFLYNKGKLINPHIHVVIEDADMSEQQINKLQRHMSNLDYDLPIVQTRNSNKEVKND